MLAVSSLCRTGVVAENHVVVALRPTNLGIRIDNPNVRLGEVAPKGALVLRLELPDLEVANSSRPIFCVQIAVARVGDNPSVRRATPRIRRSSGRSSCTTLATTSRGFVARWRRPTLGPSKNPVLTQERLTLKRRKLRSFRPLFDRPEKPPANRPPLAGCRRSRQAPALVGYPTESPNGNGGSAGRSAERFARPHVSRVRPTD